MRKALFTVLSACTLFLCQQMHAQKSGSPSQASNSSVLQNTTWKFYLGDPLYDTVYVRYTADSSFATSSKGELLVTSIYSVSNDTLVINDVGGAYSCPDQTGKYRFTINGDSMAVVLIEDDCTGRAMTLNGARWLRAQNKSTQ